MARTTNSDTLKYVGNKYELNLLAAQRVRDLNAGMESVLPASGDRNTVRALREIASGKLDIEGLRRELVQSYKTSAPAEEFTEEKVAADTEMLSAFDSEIDGSAAVAEQVAAVEAEADEAQPVAE
ncbi:MAG: DNA-directed RNA polymerase subunit omega [Rickettsiales bacterium]|jgi:DNA-directed RNA polymerase subunit omega|nr:DNA-directed RNA polymerase subunit omega [Rickettsiales bacterium]